MRFPGLRCSFGFAAGVLSACFTCANLANAEPAAEVRPPERPTITDAAEIWTLSPQQRRARLPLRIEARVDYADPMWRLLWLERNGVSSFLPLSGSAPRLPSGARVLIEGSIIPEQGLSAALAKVTVLQEHEPITPIPLHGRTNAMGELQGHVVAADVFVDSQQFIDDDHLRLALIADDRPVIGWVKPADPHALPRLAGKFAHVEGVYSARFDPTHTESGIELWIGDEGNVRTTGDLETDPAFKRTPTPIDRLFEQPANASVLVRGQAQAQVSGEYLVIRDATGQVRVQSFQQNRIPVGSEVEAIGRIGMDGPKWVLRSALYRPAGGVAQSAPTTATAPGAVESIEQLRQLSLADAARGREVKLAGVVTWSMPGDNFFYLQDVTGGIRVRFDRAKFTTPALTDSLNIEGVTYGGAFTPAVDLRASRQLGSMNAPEPKRIMYEQAATGREDGEWVELRGYLQRIDSEGDLRLIRVTTAAGDFTARLLSPVNLMANPGSLLRVRGVCEATADSAGRLTGVVLRVPFLHSIVTEEDAPADVFDLPELSVKELHQSSGMREPSRVRVAGVVLHSEPGRTTYIEDAGVGLQLLSSDPAMLKPGDFIAAVGILGHQGARIVLRQTVYRKLHDSAAPVPEIIKNPARPVPALDARLARVEGVLVDVSPQREFTRLTLQSGTTSFEALLDQGAAPAVLPRVGSELALTGIYQLAYDDTRQTRGFSLRLRSPADIVVTHPPSVWTLERALLALGILAACTLLGLAWIAALRRRVAKQTEQIRAQLERQARLEAGAERAARLESLGMLAGGIAHDFNNLLTIIVGNLSLAKLEERRTPEMLKCFAEIEHVTARARGLTRQLLTFAKGGEPVRDAIAVAPLAQEAVSRALHGSKLEVAYMIEPDLWPANADRDQVGQVIHSVVSNSVQAMPSGTLSVSLRNETLAAGAKDALAPGRYVRLTISDCGEGIPASILPRIFDPYFSTRRGSSGLGLATVYSIVKRHQGWIDVQSTVGVGTTVEIGLPAADAPKAAGDPVSPVALHAEEPVSGASATGRILLLDDEPSIRRLAGAVLERNGYSVTAIADGAEAVKEFSVALARRCPFDLLILDLTIPAGMGGREAIELIRKLDATVPAIVSSGYSNDPVMAQFERYGFQATVPKPYEVEQLLSEVRRLLNNRTDPKTSRGPENPPA